MKKSKLMLLIMALVLMVSSLAFAGGQKEGKDEGKTYLFRIGHVLQESTPSHIMLVDGFKKYVEKESEGRIKVELYPNGSLGGERKMVESAQIGTLDIAYVTTALLANFDEKFLIFDLPFLFNDLSIARKALAGDLGNAVGGELDSVKLKLLGYAENGFRHISNDVRPIYAPEDLKGIKIRTMENPIHMMSFRLLGASPTPMSFTELYTGLQQGTVDGQENPIFLTYASKFYEVQDYYSLTGHVYAPGVAVMSLKKWESLPSDLKEIVMKGWDITKELQYEILDKQNKEDLEKLKDLMEVNELTAKQKSVFIEATKPVYQKLEDQLGKDLVDLAKEANETYK